MDVTIEHGDVPYLCKRLPEGINIYGNHQINMNPWNLGECSSIFPDIKLHLGRLVKMQNHG